MMCQSSNVGHWPFFFGNHQLTENVIWREFADGGFDENGVGERYRNVSALLHIRKSAVSDFKLGIGSIVCTWCKQSTTASVSEIICHGGHA
jgi:hypothetical protein